jgi:hypothetical protein
MTISTVAAATIEALELFDKNGIALACGTGDML